MIRLTKANIEISEIPQGDRAFRADTLIVIAEMAEPYSWHAVEAWLLQTAINFALPANEIYQYVSRLGFGISFTSGFGTRVHQHARL